ncbi:MAG: hypothetical protein EOP52_13140 [Sphingobacteriales bacterium]|nr:MAG: hypothetical protein EOP52_13140 [Sphingobacteriales bacterium]
MDEVLALGEAIVQKLKIKSDDDLLSEWMAHFLAERLSHYKKASLDDKRLLEPEICDLVLKFWKHRSYFPRGQRPFEQFAPVLQALESLDPTTSEGRYFRYQIFENEDKNIPDEIQQWVKFAMSVDSASQAIISFCIGVAVSGIDNPDKELLELAGLSKSELDLDTYIRLIEVGKLVEENPKDKRKQKLVDMRNKIKALASLSEGICESIDSLLISEI